MHYEEKNTVNKMEENEPEKLKNKLLITDYAKVKNKEQKRWQPHASHDCLTFRGFKCGTMIQVFHDNNRDFRSRTLFVGEERCPVTLFESFVERRSLLKHPCDGLFFSTSAANETQKFKHLVQTKPMGENTITNMY